MEGWDGWWLLWTFHKVSAVHVMLWTSELLWTSLFLASQKAWSWKSTRFGTSKVEIRTFLDSDHLGEDVQNRPLDSQGGGDLGGWTCSPVQPGHPQGPN